MAKKHPNERLPPGSPNEGDKHHFVRAPIVPDVFSGIIRASLLHHLQKQKFSFSLGESLHVNDQYFSILLRLMQEQTNAMRERLGKDYYCYGGILLAGFPAGAEVMGIQWQLIDVQSDQVILEGSTQGNGALAFAIDGSLIQEPKQIELRFIEKGKQAE